MKCPECNHPLQRNLMDKKYVCTKKSCLFGIKEETFNQLIKDMYKKKEFGDYSEEKNLSELNNL